MSSHKDAAYFAVRDIPEWRRLVNSDVDELCGKRAAQAYQASCRPNLKEIDQVCEDVCLYLARKIGHVLLHKKEKKIPWLLQRSKEESGDPVGNKVIPNPVFSKVARGSLPTDPVSPVPSPEVAPSPVPSAAKATKSPNKKQRMLARLSGTEDSLGHQWVKGAEGPTNMTMKCDICGLYVQQINDVPSFDRLMQHPCAGRGEPLQQWDIHSTHDMINVGVQWSCSKCGRLQRPQAAMGAKNLQKPCDGRAPVSQLALGKLAQSAGNQSLSAAAPAIPVQRRRFRLALNEVTQRQRGVSALSNCPYARAHRSGVLVVEGEGPSAPGPLGQAQGPVPFSCLWNWRLLPSTSTRLAGLRWGPTSERARGVASAPVWSPDHCYGTDATAGRFGHDSVSSRGPLSSSSAPMRAFAGLATLAACFPLAPASRKGKPTRWRECAPASLPLPTRPTDCASVLKQQHA